ncbi:hypothetical protein LZT27_07775 [Aeromonas veronii]|uniref:hypothetical protein n=1 Tax=Aeromonas veronii TaxID=654 RepID=UPI0023637BBC|nr:hypothetical protein [Aeromonas veronii]MDD1844486.1 hypothetical protein [Aeromonas veronii]
MSDLLSASSLLMAIAAILFSLWYADISKAIEIEPKPHKEDNVAAKESVTTVLLSKALPVSLMAISITAIFSPDALKIAAESYDAYKTNGFELLNYNAVKTAYCFVTLTTLILSIYTLVLFFKLLILRNRLS